MNVADLLLLSACSTILCCFGMWVSGRPKTAHRWFVGGWGSFVVFCFLLAFVQSIALRA